MKKKKGGRQGRKKEESKGRKGNNRRKKELEPIETSRRRGQEKEIEELKESELIRKRAKNKPHLGMPAEEEKIPDSHTNADQSASRFLNEHNNVYDYNENDNDSNDDDAKVAPIQSEKKNAFYQSVFLALKEEKRNLHEERLSKNGNQVNVLMFRRKKTLYIVFSRKETDEAALLEFTGDSSFSPFKIEPSQIEENKEENTEEEKKEGKDIKVHNKVITEYNSVRKYIHNRIKKYKGGSSIDEVFISGFSIAGAIANICALDLSVKYERRNFEYNLITLGAMKAGNRDFADEVNRRMNGLNMRIKFVNDIVAAAFHHDYHAGNKVYIKDYPDEFRVVPFEVPAKKSDDLCSCRRTLFSYGDSCFKNEAYDKIEKDFLRKVLLKYNSEVKGSSIEDLIKDTLVNGSI